MTSPTSTRRTDVDRQVTLLHDKYWQEVLDAAHRKDIILVEGEDDRLAIEGILDGRLPTWSTRIKIIAAGSRDNVLGDGRRRCEDRAQRPYLVVDRDAWTDAEVEAQREHHERLHVTEGWCLENIFLDPQFLRGFNLPAAQAVAEGRKRWLRAGALWWTLQRTREAVQRWQLALGGSFGVPHDELDFSSATELAAAFRARIPEDLRRAASLDVDTFAVTFEQRLTTVLAWPEAQQWRMGVHGKHAFRHLLLPALQRRNAGDWRPLLARAVGRPPPFDALLAVLLP